MANTETTPKPSLADQIKAVRHEAEIAEEYGYKQAVVLRAACRTLSNMRKSPRSFVKID